MAVAPGGMRAGLALMAVVPCLLTGLSCGKDAGPGERAPAEPIARTLPARGQQTEDENGPQRPVAEVENLALAKAIDRKICRKRGCCVSGIEDAGTDHKGRSMVVATIDAGSGGVASCLVPPPLVPTPFGNGALDIEPCPIETPAETPAPSTEGGSDAEEEASDEGQAAASDPESEDCRPFEYHLIVHTHGKIRDHQLLSEQCNNGYGAAGVGEDSIGVDKEARTFSHDQSGGSAWRGDRGIVVGLDPLRVVSVDQSSFWTFDEAGTEKSAEWNYDTFQGSESWSIPDCDERRKYKEAAARDAAAAAGPEPNASKTYNAVTVPRVALPPAFAQDGWRSIALGNCGAFVDGDDHGFAVYGGRGRAADASLRAVVSKDGVLFVEITDDRWTSGAKSWVKEDHIELWLAPSGIVGTDLNCGEPSGPEPPDPSRQWGIRISDGQVFPAFGSPAPLAGVEVVRSGHVARARIPVDDWLKGDGDASSLTIVYSDSDDGLRQKRLIATSEIERGRVSSLGHLRDVDPDVATCVVKGKALQIYRAPLTTSPHQAIADP